MYKKVIEFEGFDGQLETQEHYFHVSKLEATKINAKYGGNIQQYMTNLIEEGDTLQILEFIEEFILAAHGVRSEDGLRFIKNEDTRTEFSQSLAFEALIVELLTDEEAINEFTTKVIPVSKQVAKESKVELIRKG